MFEFNATLIVAMISFVVFMIIMNNIFYRPILNIIRKRDEFVSQNYQSAENMSKMAQEINNEYQTKLDETKKNSRNHLIKEMDLAQNEHDDKIRSAKEKAKIQIQKNKDIIESQGAELKENLDSVVIESVSSEILKKVMG